MSIISTDPKSSEVKKESASQAPEFIVSESMQTGSQLCGHDFSYTMNPVGVDGGNENDIATGMGVGSTGVYSPFFMVQMFQEKTPNQSSKFSGGYGHVKVEGMYTISQYWIYSVDDIELAKSEVPPITLPHSVNKFNLESCSKLENYMKKNTNFVNECLEQLEHLSVCREVENECSFPFCIPLRRDVYGMRSESKL